MNSGEHPSSYNNLNFFTHTTVCLHMSGPVIGAVCDHLRQELALRFYFGNTDIKGKSQQIQL